jgi:hypothetical protein
MAAPIASYVQLPSDASNTGKKNRTQSKTVGSDTVHEHFIVPTEGYTRIGRYFHCSTANRAVVNTAVAITTDTVGTYLYMSTLSATTARVGVLREVSVSYGCGDPVISKTAPVITATKYTFNVAHSGTTQNICQAQTSSTVPLANVSLAPTGATITAAGDFGSAVIPAIFTTVGNYTGGKQVLYEDHEPYNRGAAVEFKSGEGIAVHQTISGTASDTRVFTVKLVWDEIDVS